MKSAGTPKTTSWDQIITSAPVNRDAAFALKGTDADPALTARQQRENLLPTLWRLQEAVRDGPLEDRPAIREKLHALNLKLRELKPPKQPPGYESHFINAARDLLPLALFRTISNEAHRRLETQDSEASRAEMEQDGE